MEKYINTETFEVQEIDGVIKGINWRAIPEGTEVVMKLMNRLKFFKNSLREVFENGKWITSDIKNPEEFYDSVIGRSHIVWETDFKIIEDLNDLKNHITHESKILYSTDDINWYPLDGDSFITLDFIIQPNLKFKVIN